ncbi:DUF427 domain-containing protein [Amycolatopsis pithecellobii]|uniref:DUF427 domain-containing protein n=1 Tax=Amycolatopsis pithecellobii TaxID=664692 RepID=A0A6N7YXM6_9PSEU|nr:DUF427 domain-containing protein [Amycolatopsis pithecellobii]MTD53089.1 DUF427 domain-containing protein [Amycolatopsis pithecellobii]
MKAKLEDRVIATADTKDLVMIEGNWYFPPSSVNWSLLESSPTVYTCPWKGQAEYYSLVGGPKDVAWAYVAPHADAVERVGKDFAKFVAFDRAVAISE